MKQLLQRNKLLLALLLVVAISFKKKKATPSIREDAPLDLSQDDEAQARAWKNMDAGCAPQT